MPWELMLLYHAGGRWKLYLRGDIAYGGSGGPAYLLARFSRNRSAGSLGLGDVAGVGYLRFGGHVCDDEQCALYGDEARYGAHGSTSFSASDVDCVRHRGVGVSGCYRIAALEGAESGRDMPDGVAVRDVSGQCESGARAVVSARQAGNRAMVEGSDAGVLDWVDLVGQPVDSLGADDYFVGG